MIMRKIVSVLLAMMFLLSASANADNKRPVEVSQLPSAAQQIINKHYSRHTVVLATVKKEHFKKEYEVVFDNGDKIEFDKSGDWKEIESKASVVPLALIPKAIWQQIRMKYPKTAVKKIDRDKKGYEVKLTNMVELTFDKHFNLIEVDVD